MLDYINSRFAALDKRISETISAAIKTERARQKICLAIYDNALDVWTRPENIPVFEEGKYYIFSIEKEIKLGYYNLNGFFVEDEETFYEMAEVTEIYI